MSAAGSILDRFDRLIDQVLPPHDTQEAEAIATLGGEVIEWLRRPDEAPEIAAACAHALVTIGTTSARGALEAFKETEHQIVAAELAFAFNPLELPYWQAKVRRRPEDWPTRKALQDAIASQVTDLVPLKLLTDVQELYLDGVATAELAPLKSLSGLQALSLDNTAVDDLTPLKGLSSLKYLSLVDTTVADLAPLKGLSNLQTLDLKGTAVEDLSRSRGSPPSSG